MHKKDYLVHRLVAITFIKNKKNKPFVNHKDGNKTNNSVINLEWCTAKENSIHAADHKLLSPIYGEDNHFAKRKNKEIIKICNLIKKGYKSSQILDIMGFEVNRQNKYLISLIRHKKTWKHITRDFNFDNIDMHNYCEDAYNAVNDNETINNICKLLENGVVDSKIICKNVGLEYNKINKNLIYEIKYKKSWKKISDNYNFDFIPPDRRKKYDDKTIKYILKLDSENKSTKEICNILNIPYDKKSISTISRIRVKNKSH